MGDDDPDELVTAAEIGRRLGLSGQRIRQLSRDGQLPSPAGKAGQNVLWRWHDVRDWAAATSRLDVDDDRPPSQVWQVRRSKRPRFVRTVDTVVGFGGRSSVHVRIWKPVEQGLRPVVVLGNLDDNRGPSVTNAIDLAATTVAADLLGPDGLNADWYEYWPAAPHDTHVFSAVTFDVHRVRARLLIGRGGHIERVGRRVGGTLEDPKWSDVQRRRLEDLVGEHVEVYPAGVYTRETVERRAKQGVVEVEWDPESLRVDVEAADVVLNDRGLGERLDASVAAAALVGDWKDRAVANRESADKQPEGLAVTLVPYVPPVGAEWLARVDGCDSMTDAVALEQARQGLRRWLLEHGDEFDRAALVPGPRGLVDLPPWMAGFLDVPPASGQIVGAVRQADRAATFRLHEIDGWDGSVEFPNCVPSDAFSSGSTTADRYLDTVGWWGPRQDDQWTAYRLRKQFDSDADLRFGYDPSGHLVAASSKAFAVDWPVGQAHLPSDGYVVADASARGPQPAFVEDVDGRLHPLPLAPADWESGVGFTWGYSGSGPAALTWSLLQLLADGPIHRRGGRAPEDQRAKWALLNDIVVGLPPDLLRIPITDLVDATQGALR